MPKQSDSRQYPEKPTPKARLEHLKKSNRCIGCGSKGHSFAECKARGCMHCGKKHHTSTCFKSSATHEASKAQTPNWKKEEKQKSSKARQNLTLCEEEDTHTDNDNTDNFTVMKVEDASHRTQQGEIFLLSGALRTLHPRTKKFVKVSVLLDTGADRSFIDERLAKKLQLPNHGVVSMKLSTFGAATAKGNPMHQDMHECEQREQHKLQLYTHKILTRNISGGKLQQEDLQYIHRKQITLSSAPSGIAQPPEVLIGCDQLWNFIKFEAPHFVLPSGLKLIPTSLGYMVTGKRIQKHAHSKLHSTVHSIGTERDNDLWESHWNEESKSIEKEYCGPYVTNRVREIQKIVQSLTHMGVKVEFGYIETKWNPADIGTRGASAQEILSHVWWRGYPLKRILDGRFASNFFSLSKELEGEEETECVSPVYAMKTREGRVEDILDLARYSSITKSLRVLAYVIRFLKSITSRLDNALQSKLRNNLPCLNDPNQEQYLTASDIRNAHDVLIRNHQAVHISPQYKKALSKTLNMKEDKKQIMASQRRDDEFSKKRRAEEHKLIEEIRRKRACVRKMQVFPSEEIIQSKIRNFVKSIVLIVTSSCLSDKHAHIRGNKPQYLAHMRAALYKAHLENIYSETCHIMAKESGT
ncbi:Tas retrotransposon peptidase A16 [Ostertagia ostertagi]